MARAAPRRAQREARAARPGNRHTGGGKRTAPASAIENQLFFTRLRNQAKWAFALMVVVFGAGFAFLGVGCGGLDLGSLIQDAFGTKGSSGTSITQAVTTKVSTATQQATSRYQTAAAAAIATFQRLTKALPNQDSYFQLARAGEEFQNTKVAVAANTALLKRHLVTDAATKRGIK